MKQIDLISTDFGNRLSDAGFARITARRYLRVTLGDIAQRIELRPNRHGGEVTCDLTIHPLFAHQHLPVGCELESLLFGGSLPGQVQIQAVWWQHKSQSNSELASGLNLTKMPQNYPTWRTCSRQMHLPLWQNRNSFRAEKWA